MVLELQVSVQPGHGQESGGQRVCSEDTHCLILRASAVARQSRTPRSEGPHNIYCISKLHPSLCPWLLLFWFLPSVQSRYIKHV